MSDDAFEITTKLTRGTGTDDRDTIKASVGADTVAELDEKLDAVQERLEDWAADIREIQPEQKRKHPESQTTIGEGSV